MKIKHYKNFDECFYELNREIIKNPKDNLDKVNSTLGYINNLIISFDSYDCTLDLSDLGYKKNKWTSIVHENVNREQFEVYRNTLDETRLDSHCFNFETKYLSKGGTVLSLVLSKHDKRLKWKKCTVFFRTTEINKGLAVDMVLIHVMLRELQKHIDIQQVVFNVAQATVSNMLVCGLFDYLDIGCEETDEEHPFGKSLVNNYNLYFKQGVELSKYETLKRMQKVAFGLEEFPSINVNDLHILGEE